MPRCKACDHVLSVDHPDEILCEVCLGVVSDINQHLYYTIADTDTDDTLPAISQE